MLHTEHVQPIVHLQQLVPHLREPRHVLRRRVLQLPHQDVEHAPRHGLVPKAHVLREARHLRHQVLAQALLEDGARAQLQHVAGAQLVQAAHRRLSARQVQQVVRRPRRRHARLAHLLRRAAHRQIHHQVQQRPKVRTPQLAAHLWGRLGPLHARATAQEQVQQPPHGAGAHQRPAHRRPLPRNVSHERKQLREPHPVPLRHGQQVQRRQQEPGRGATPPHRWLRQLRALAILGHCSRHGRRGRRLVHLLLLKVRALRRHPQRHQAAQQLAHRRTHLGARALQHHDAHAERILRRPRHRVLRRAGAQAEQPHQRLQ
mmetsp:Transcript_3252/g.10186  ORF Transcript_3252/g.10186 Transcript_3252/m.10186 type:complete len:316 (-) Transcript_3252:934-1881(-)